MAGMFAWKKGVQRSTTATLFMIAENLSDHRGHDLGGLADSCQHIANVDLVGGGLTRDSGTHHLFTVRD